MIGVRSGVRVRVWDRVRVRVQGLVFRVWVRVRIIG